MLKISLAFFLAPYFPPVNVEGFFKMLLLFVYFVLAFLGCHKALADLFPPYIFNLRQFLDPVKRVPCTVI